MIITLLITIILMELIMNFLKFFKPKKGKGISIVIPFRSANSASERKRNFEWVKKYWQTQLPGAQVIVGIDPDTHLPFSKSIAINNGVAEATGDIIVIADADCYIKIDHVLDCVNQIRDARKRGHRLWFVPYRQFFRLTEQASMRLLASDINDPLTFPNQPALHDIINDTNPRTGHWYGAMIHILPKEAFEIVGGWDERFRGWGGEDHAAMRAFDTLYWPHKTLPSSVFHIWHPMIGKDGIQRIVHWTDRRWEGQDDPSINNRLSWRYYHAFNKIEIMRRLVDEWIKLRKHKHHHKPHCPSKHHHHEPHCPPIKCSI
jgi:hypothetical protein